MCFGNDQTTQTQTTTPPAWLSSAAQSNLGYAESLRNSGFTPYSGKQVAAFSPQQTQSFGLGTDIANASAPNIPTGARALSNYTTAGPQRVQGSTIADNMSPYLNQYVSYALAPQLAASRSNQALQSQLMQGQATSAGAFGDPRANNLQATQSMLAALQEQGLVGTAYNNAFNTAIGAGAQDVSFGLNAQTTNANLAEQALQRQLTGSNAIFSQGTGATNLENTLGGQQTAQTQAGLNAAYNQWLMKQQYPFQVSQLMNQDINAARTASPTTTTTSSPNNAGYGLVGAAVGALPGIIGSSGGVLGGASGLLGLAALSDPKVKEDAEQVGELYDGTPVHKFRFKGSPETKIGLMAPEVQKKTPSAVDASGPLKMVDYNKATKRSADMGRRMTLADQLGVAA